MQRTPRAALWIFLTTAGLAAGLLTALVIGVPLGRIANAMLVTGIVTSAVGAVLGTFQAVGLRRTLPRPSWWVVASAIGIGVGLAAGVTLVEQTGILITGTRPNIARLSLGTRAASLIAVGLFAGAMLGLAQSVVFRAQGLRVRHWIGSSAAGLAIAFASSAFLIEMVGLRFASAAGVIGFVILSGAMFGALTSRSLRNAV